MTSSNAAVKATLKANATLPTAKTQLIHIMLLKASGDKGVTEANDEITGIG